MNRTGKWSRRRRDVMTALAATCSAGAIAACGSGSSTGADAGSGTGSASGGTLTVVSSVAPPSMNPLLVGYGNVGAQTVDLAYSNFFTWLGKNDFQPVLAKSYRFLGSGHREIQIVLRPGVKFSDGTPLNAAAEKTFLQYFEHAKAQGSAVAAGLIKSISTPNSETIDVTFTRPYPDAPLLFSDGGTWGSPISPKALKGNTKELGYETFGAGPYKLQSAVSGSTYTYVPNPDYYDKSAQHWGKVVIKVIANPSSALETVRGSQYGVMQGSWEQESQAKGAGLEVTASGAPLLYQLFLTGRGGKPVPALGNVKVRQAMNYAVDRSTIASLLHGSPDEQIITPQATGYYHGTVYPHNIAKAKQLLKEAGYPHGLSMSLIVMAYVPSVVSAAQAAASELAQAGIKLHLVTPATFNEFLQAQGSKKYPADIEDQSSTTLFSAAEAWIAPGGYANVWHSSDPQLNAQIAKASVLSGSAQTAAWERLSKMVAEKAWFVPLAYTPELFITKNVKVAPNALYPNPDDMTP